jgi:bla regulator protein BlaR1
MTLAIVLEIALKSALIAGAALALLAVLKRLPAAQRAFVAHVGLALALMTPLWVLFGPRLEMTGFWSRTPAPATHTPISAPATPVAASIPTENFFLTGETIAFAVYALIAGLLLAALAISLSRLLRLQRDAAVLTEPTWLMALAHAQQRMGMKQGTALLQNGRLASPVSWGFLRPTIMVNPAILESGEKAEAVLAHELAHVVRMDWLNLLIARLATAVLWFNPLVWLLAWQAHELREEAADDVVLRGNVRRADYAALLVDFARRERTSPLAAAHGVSPSKDALKRRLTRVLDPEARRDPAAPAWTLTCVVAALLIAAPVAAFTPVDHAPRAAAVNAGQASQRATASAFAKAQAAPASTATLAQADEPAATVQVRDERNAADTLVAMRVHGVTPEYIGEIERAYPPARNMSNDDFIAFRVHGVTPEWLRGFSAAGYVNISPEQVSGFAALGVSPQYIRELRAAGLPRPSADELMGLRALGVTGDYVRELTAAGMADLSVDDVMELRAVGVTGPDARAFGPHGDPPPSSAPPHPPDPPHPQHD